MIYRRLFDVPAFRTNNPFGELENMRRQFDRIMNVWSGATQRSVGAGVFPLVNVTEDLNKYYVRAELPGVKDEALDIQATGKTLSISGERRIPHEGGTVARYHRREREGGKFSRVLTMPGDIDASRIEARLQNGILTVMIPKAEAAKPRQIKVN